MHSRFHQTAAGLGLALILAGCAMPRHSNMMVFGTNTTVGLSVGADATSTPAIEVGYKRQEAVLMPLVANTKSRPKTVKPGETPVESELVPCDLAKLKGWHGVLTAAENPCILAASRQSGDHQFARDSYSVLASFGAQFDASASKEVKAKGGLAQYFATGMAAQLLALNGGASVVATGDAAKTSAQNPASAAAVAAVVGTDPKLAASIASAENQAKATKNIADIKTADEITEKYLGALIDAEFESEVAGIYVDAGRKTAPEPSCKLGVSFNRGTCYEDLHDAILLDRDWAKIIEVITDRRAARGGS